MTILLSYKSLPGYFAAYPNANSGDINSQEIDHLELTSVKSWKQLYNSIPRDTDTRKYKLLIVARHGQGFHNAAIDRYGEDKWDEYWSLLDGDEHGDWFDSKLTPVGKEQVRQTGETVLHPIVRDIGLFPHVFFSSPMRRCLETFIESWTPVLREERTSTDKISTIILENIRERLGEHTCDKRVNHSVAVGEYQNYKTKSGHTINWKYSSDYPEEDQLWLADWRETNDEIDARIKNGLNEIFEQLTDDQRMISITCHSGVIGSILRNLKHPAIKNLSTGKVVCTVVEITKE